MANADVWSTIHAERRALVADLASLTEAQWAKVSLCAWTFSKRNPDLAILPKKAGGVIFAVAAM